MLHLLRIYTFWINVELNLWHYLKECQASIAGGVGWGEIIFGMKTLLPIKGQNWSNICKTHIKFMSMLLCLLAPLHESLGKTEEIGYNFYTKRTCNLDRKIRTYSRNKWEQMRPVAFKYFFHVLHKRIWKMIYLLYIILTSRFKNSKKYK